jgi:hypothetical protein
MGERCEAVENYFLTRWRLGRACPATLSEAMKVVGGQRFDPELVRPVDYDAADPVAGQLTAFPLVEDRPGARLRSSPSSRAVTVRSLMLRRPGSFLRSGRGVCCLRAVSSPSCPPGWTHEEALNSRPGASSLRNDPFCRIGCLTSAKRCATTGVTLAVLRTAHVDGNAMVQGEARRSGRRALGFPLLKENGETPTGPPTCVSPSLDPSPRRRPNARASRRAWRPKASQYSRSPRFGPGSPSFPFGRTGWT